MTNPEDIRELKKIDNSYQIQKYSSYSLEELFTLYTSSKKTLFIPIKYHE